MKRFKLTPIYPADSVWKYSETIESVIIEAENEDAARIKAMGKYGKPAESGPPGEENPQEPWTDPAKVSCEEII